MDIFLFIASTTASLYFNKISKRKSPASYEVSKKHIITVGLLCLDIHAASVDSLPEGGGVHFIDKIHLSCAGTSGGTVITLAKLGLSIAIFGCIGKSDESGCYLLNKLKSLHVSTHGIQYSPTKPTSATVINVRSNGDRPCLHQLGASDDLDLSSSNLLQQVIASNPEIIHIGGLGLTPGCIQEKTLLMFLQSVATHFNLKPKIVLDLIAPHAGTLDALLPILPHIDFFMPSLEEAEFISGKSGVEACASFFLDRGVRQACVLKDGARGSFLVQQKASMTTTKDSVHPSELRSEIPATMSSNRKNDLVVTHIPAYRIDKVVDTTGCGDNYCAGFECGLIKGWNLVECCRLGAAASALCATGVGSDAGNVDFQFAVDFMNTVQILSAN